MTEFKDYMIDHPGLISPVSRMVVKLKNRGTIISYDNLREAALSSNCLVAFNDKECIANYDAKCLRPHDGDLIPFCKVDNEELVLKNKTLEDVIDIIKERNESYSWLSWFF